MYYGYNSFTGRLIGMNRMKAYSPQGLQTLGPADPVNPYPNYHPKPAPTPASTTTVRAASGVSQQTEYGKVPERILRLRAKFQAASHLPVHLKGGPRDYFFYYTTVALCVTGVIMSLRVVYKFAFPQKAKDN